MKLPKWFDDWSNIPKETEEDTPDVKAIKVCLLFRITLYWQVEVSHDKTTNWQLQRFLLGDSEYKNERAKLVPYIVDGPMAIRLIKPKPQEFNLHGLRHPVSWHNVSKTKEKSGNVSAALLECDIDFVSNPAIRKVISMVRPHLSKITIDLALIVSKPKDSDEDEPHACVGMWRIDKVDFESCAVFPEKSIEEVAEEVKSFIALEARDGSISEIGVIAG